MFTYVSVTKMLKYTAAWVDEAPKEKHFMTRMENIGAELEQIALSKSSFGTFSLERFRQNLCFVCNVLNVPISFLILV